MSRKSNINVFMEVVIITIFNVILLIILYLSGFWPDG